MTYIVHGASGSGSMPVEAALTLIGADYRVVEAVTWESEAERDKVSGINPMRQIPVLTTPDGEVMTESAAILMWLAERYPEAGLAPPPGDPRRGQFLRWMSFIPASIYSMYWVRDEPERLLGQHVDVAGDTLLERTADRIAHCWGVMEGQTDPGRFILGDDLTVLDLYVTVASRWTPRRKRFAEVAPRLHEVVRRVDNWPALEAFWAERFPFAKDEAR